MEKCGRGACNGRHNRVVAHIMASALQWGCIQKKNNVAAVLFTITNRTIHSGFDVAKLCTLNWGRSPSCVESDGVKRSMCHHPWVPCLWTSSPNGDTIVVFLSSHWFLCVVVESEFFPRGGGGLCSASCSAQMYHMHTMAASLQHNARFTQVTVERLWTSNRGGGGGSARGFSAGKIPYFNLVRNVPLIFRGEVQNFPMQNCACVSHRRTRWGFFLAMIMLNKGANVCWCLISSKAQACVYALQILWHRNAMFSTTHCLPKFRDPRFLFASNALKIWEVRNFPLDFLGQVRKIPRSEFSPAEKTLYRIPPPPGTPNGDTIVVFLSSHCFLCVVIESEFFPGGGVCAAPLAAPKCTVCTPWLQVYNTMPGPPK